MTALLDEIRRVRELCAEVEEFRRLRKLDQIPDERFADVNWRFENALRNLFHSHGAEIEAAVRDAGRYRARRRKAAEGLGATTWERLYDEMSDSMIESDAAMKARP